MIERTMTLTAAAKSLAAVVERTLRRKEATLLLRNGRPVARIVPVPTLFLRLQRSGNIDSPPRVR